jgi:hypothetical protein
MLLATADRVAKSCDFRSDIRSSREHANVEVRIGEACYTLFVLKIVIYFIFGSHFTSGVRACG